MLETDYSPRKPVQNVQDYLAGQQLQGGDDQGGPQPPKPSDPHKPEEAPQPGKKPEKPAQQ